MRMMWVNALGESNQFKQMKKKKKEKTLETLKIRNTQKITNQQKTSEKEEKKKKINENTQKHWTHAYEFDAEQRQWPSNLELYSLRQKVKA